jgi:type VI protein secretion system component VasK
MGRQMLETGSIVSWLDNHQGFATVVLTVALMLLTVYYAYQNRRMASEMRSTREEARDQHRADEESARLREVRSIADEATIALREMWSVLVAFSYAMNRGPGRPERSPVEGRDLSPEQFGEVYDRLRDVATRLANRVELGDTFYAPVSRALNSVQSAYNEIVWHDPLDTQGAPESKQKILTANGQVSESLRELQETCRQRFAPLGLPGARYSVLLVLTVKQSGQRATDILRALRAEPWRPPGGVVGPNDEGTILEIRRLLVGELERG